MRELFKHCLKFKRFSVNAYLLSSLLICQSLCADIGRKPANFVPDDDMIIVPMVIEKNFLEKFNDKHKNEFSRAKKTLQFWISQEDYAKNYGLEDTGFVNLPTPAEKQRFLEKNYLRFISKDIEKSSNQTLQDTVESWTDDDEIDSIEMIELHEKTIIKAKRSKGKRVVKHTQTIKVGKDKLKFGIQPRIELGMVKLTLHSKRFKVRAWVGANGNQEVKIEHKIKKTKTKAFVNYYIDEAKILAAVDQKLSRHWKLRFTHSKTAEGFNEVLNSSDSENNIVQLRFGMGF